MAELRGRGDSKGAAYERLRGDKVAMLLMLPAFVLLIAAYLPGRIKAKVKPTVEIMNMMGFTSDGLGNHNFDRGQTYLRTELIPLAQFRRELAGDATLVEEEVVDAADDAEPCVGPPDRSQPHAERCVHRVRRRQGST